MDRVRYQQYLKQYIAEAIQQSDGSTRGIAEHLQTCRFTVEQHHADRTVADVCWGEIHPR